MGKYTTCPTSASNVGLRLKFWGHPSTIAGWLKSVMMSVLRYHYNQSQIIRGASAITEGGTRLNIAANSFWGGCYERAYFVVKVSLMLHPTEKASPPHTEGTKESKSEHMNKGKSTVEQEAWVIRVSWNKKRKCMEVSRMSAVKWKAAEERIVSLVTERECWTDQRDGVSTESRRMKGVRRRFLMTARSTLHASGCPHGELQTSAMYEGIAWEAAS